MHVGLVGCWFAVGDVGGDVGCDVGGVSNVGVIVMEGLMFEVWLWRKRRQKMRMQRYGYREADAAR